MSVFEICLSSWGGGESFIFFQLFKWPIFNPWARQKKFRIFFPKFSSTRKIAQNQIKTRNPSKKMSLKSKLKAHLLSPTCHLTDLLSGLLNTSTLILLLTTPSPPIPNENLHKFIFIILFFLSVFTYLNNFVFKNESVDKVWYGVLGLILNFVAALLNTLNPAETFEREHVAIMVFLWGGVVVSLFGVVRSKLVE